MKWLTQHRYSVLDIAGFGIGAIVLGRCGLLWFLAWACFAAAVSYCATTNQQRSS